jgi:hypothetical protein
MLKARDRRDKEDQSKRLQSEVPKLLELRLDIEEGLADSSVAGTRYTRIVVVPSAAALFELGCSESSCKDGGHDLTREILYALGRGEESFTGESLCGGQVGTANCRRLLKYRAAARYDQGAG